MNKICSRCKEEKSFLAFYKLKRSKDGLTPQCKACCYRYHLAYVAKNKDKVRAVKKKYDDNNKEKKAAYNKVRRVTSKEKVKNITRNSELKRNFGITLDEYNVMRESQNYACALCKKPESDFKRRLAVDHNHKTGQIRGLLCFPCNKYKVGRHTIESSKAIHEYLVKYDKAS